MLVDDQMRRHLPTRLGLEDVRRRQGRLGVEPEGIAVFELGDRTLAFIGLERTTVGAIAIFDITDPANATLLDTILGNTAADLRPGAWPCSSRPAPSTSP